MIEPRGTDGRPPVVLPPNQGRSYPTGDNRSGSRAGFLNVSAPGDFESHMPGIADWFRTRSPADSDC